MANEEPIRIVRTKCLNCGAGIGFRLGDRYYADEPQPAFCSPGCAQQYEAKLRRLPKSCAEALRSSLGKQNDADRELTEEQRSVIERLLERKEYE